MGKIYVHIFNIDYSNVHHQSIIVKLWNAWSAVQAWTLIQSLSIFQPIIFIVKLQKWRSYTHQSIVYYKDMISCWRLDLDSRFMCLSTNYSMTSEVESCCSYIHRPIIRSRTPKADIQLHTAIEGSCPIH